MIFNQFSKWTFHEFVNARFHLFVTQTREIHVFTRVRNVFWNIVLFAFHLIFGCSNHRMLILGPLAAQLSYLSINILGPRIPRARFTSAPKRRPAFDRPKCSGVSRMQLPASMFQFLTSKLHSPASKLQHPGSRLQIPGFRVPWMARSC